ncbi:hypothetical protein ACIA5C_31160 [Actinoplanes sp. NPDC051343]|jgi:hypothetical protein|uniref:hypothetical protein n=1 Tax=Actinoplanes sp. NPDC051343 TaxID=3363906 RepID=UPI00378C1505
MSARKLGRFAGLVFVLAVVFGAVGAVSVEHARAVTGASTAAQSVNAAAQSVNVSVEWD